MPYDSVEASLLLNPFCARVGGETHLVLLGHLEQGFVRVPHVHLPPLELQVHFRLQFRRRRPRRDVMLPALHDYATHDEQTILPDPG
jgi:hypothetical protein